MGPLALMACLVLAGCVDRDTAFPPSPIVQTPRGAAPVICYVRARDFIGYVPVSCATAAMIRP